jgi:hypothetical protein
VNFHCDGCQTNRDQADLKRCVIDQDKNFLRYCRFCISGTAKVVDVYWDGKEEHGLADGPDGKPRVFSSRGEKAAYLKERGLMEAGDRIRGSYPTLEEPKRTDGKAAVKEALRKVAEMSPDYRRQEYLRLKHEAQQRGR